MPAGILTEMFRFWLLPYFEGFIFLCGGVYEINHEVNQDYENRSKIWKEIFKDYRHLIIQDLEWYHVRKFELFYNLIYIKFVTPKPDTPSG